MHIEEIREHAKQKRQSAKDKLHQAFGFTEGVASNLVDEVIDDILSAALLEVAESMANLDKSK